MFNKTESQIVIDQATIDHFVAKGRRERSQTAVAFIKGLFTKSETTPTPAKDAIAA